MARGLLVLLGLSVSCSLAPGEMLPPLTRECEVAAYALASSPSGGVVTSEEVDVVPSWFMSATACAESETAAAGGYAWITGETTDTELMRNGWLDAGAVSPGSGFATVNALIHEEISFVLTEPLPVTLGGAVARDPDADSVRGTVALVGRDRVLQWGLTDGIDELLFNYSGVLEPGEYTLSFLGQASTASDEGISFPGAYMVFAYDFKAVPEPAAGLLLVLGTLALSRRSARPRYQRAGRRLFRRRRSE